jgi:fido (protein-threonine AMPylation protein)
MHPPDCPEWEYTDHPESSRMLPRSVASLLSDLRRGAIDPSSTATDTRTAHLRMFRGLTPPGYDYYAGHYRGENFRCLEFCRVGIRNDPSVGCPPDSVDARMHQLADIIAIALNGLDAGHRLPNSHLPDKLKIAYTVVVTCRVFAEFLEIHPFVNGNGHAARLLVVCLLGRYGYWPQRWTVEPRPPDPPHTELIRQYRHGNKEPLESYILSFLAP